METGKEAELQEMIDLNTVIGVYPLCNTGAVLVHKIDYGEDKVLASINGKDPEWCGMAEAAWDDEEDEELGFYLGSLFVPFSQVMRFYGGGE